MEAVQKFKKVRKLKKRTQISKKKKRKCRFLLINFCLFALYKIEFKLNNRNEDNNIILSARGLHLHIYIILFHRELFFFFSTFKLNF